MVTKNAGTVKKKTLKIIFQNPHTIEWPKISNETCEQLKTLLKNLNMKNALKATHWSVKKQMPKEKYCRRTTKNIIFGLKDCRKLINEGMCKNLLIDDDLNPKFLAEDLLNEAEKKFVPFQSVPNMKQLTKELIGFPASCIGMVEGSDITLTLPENFTNKKEIKKYLDLHLVKVCNNAKRKEKF